jgi:formylglycine-generating enzyme
MVARADLQRKSFIALGFVLGVGAFVWVIREAFEHSAPPSRCAAGMAFLGPRCCGEGQKLDGQRCVGRPQQCVTGLEMTDAGCVAPTRRVTIAGGVLRIGPGDWEAQGQVTPRTVEVPAFVMDAYEVHEARYSACVAASACVPIALSGEPGRALGGITLEEAARFCVWAGGALPTAEQLAFAAAGNAGRRYAWGDTGAVCRRAAWGLLNGPCGEGATGPEITGSHPDGASPEGIFDLAGNVAEWSQPTNAGVTLVDVRGGSYRDGAASALRSWHRREVEVTTRAVDIGFRCVYGEDTRQKLILR